MIVADTGPIIAFARVGRLELLRQVVEKLVVPEAVYEDLVIKGQGRPDEELLPAFLREIGEVPTP